MQMHPATIPFKGLTGYFGYRASLVPLEGRASWDVTMANKARQETVKRAHERYYGGMLGALQVMANITRGGKHA